MCGELGVNTSSHVSLPTTASATAIAATPIGTVFCPVIAAIIPGSAYSSRPRPCDAGEQPRRSAEAR